MVGLKNFLILRDREREREKWKERNRERERGREVLPFVFKSIGLSAIKLLERKRVRKEADD